MQQMTIVSNSKPHATDKYNAINTTNLLALQQMTIVITGKPQATDQ